MSKTGNRNCYARIRAEREAVANNAIRELLSKGARQVHCSERYLVTRDGHVYSTLNRRVRRLLPGIKPGGYEFVGIYDEPRQAHYEMVHRLVAIAFIPNPRGLPEVNHIDGNKRNNIVANLEWCDRKANAMHAHDLGLMPSGPGSKTVDEATAFAIRRAQGRYRDIGAAFGVSAQTVCNIKRGHTKSGNRTQQERKKQA